MCRLTPSARGEALDAVSGSFDVHEEKGELCFPDIPEGGVPSRLNLLGFCLKQAEPRIAAEKRVVLVEKLRLVLDRNDVVTAPGPDIPIQIFYWKGNHVCDLFLVVGADSL